MRRRSATIAATPTETERNPTMWYFAWILGLPLAATFAVLNAMWYELMEDEAIRHDKLDKP
jgi:cytochrome bd-I ubiquinol oxidase subunit X